MRTILLSLSATAIATCLFSPSTFADCPPVATVAPIYAKFVQSFPLDGVKSYFDSVHSTIGTNYAITHMKKEDGGAGITKCVYYNDYSKDVVLTLTGELKK